MKSLLLPLFLSLLLGFTQLHGSVVIPGYRAKALVQARDVGIALKFYADDHDGKLPNSLKVLYPDYISDSRAYEHMILTTPGLILRDLSDECIIVVRTVPEDTRYIVAVYSTIATRALKVSPATSDPKPADNHDWPLTSIVLGISGWFVALILWCRRHYGRSCST